MSYSWEYESAKRNERIRLEELKRAEEAAGKATCNEEIEEDGDVTLYPKPF